MMHRTLRFILHPSFFLILLMVAFAFFFSALAVQQHRAFQTNGLDLGNVDQALWNTAQGRFLYFTLMTPIESRLALHVEPILLLFVPFYWLNLGSPELLLIVQASVVALGAWPLYQLSITNYQSSMSTTPDHPSRNSQTQNSKLQNSKLKTQDSPPHPPPSALLLVFPLSYLLLPTLESAVLFDFHAVTMASTFLLFAFWTLEQKREVWFIIFCLLAMACKEDMPLVVAMLGLYAGLAGRRWYLAGLTLGLSIAWFIVVFFVIQPHFAVGGNIQLDRYDWLGANPLQMLQTVLTQPGLVFDHLWIQADLPGYLTRLFFPTAFLALFSPLTLLPMLPTLAINLLSNNPFTWRLEDFHYGAPLAPFLFISTIYGIKRISGWIQRVNDRAKERKSESIAHHEQKSTILPQSPLLILLTLLLLIFTAIYHYQRGFTPLARPFIWPQVTAHHRLLDEVVTTIPADAAVFTQSNLAPHLTHRLTLYSDFAYFTDPDFPAASPADDILLDVTAFENIGGLHQFLRQTLLESGNYRLVTAQDGLLHLKVLADKGQREKATPTSYSLLPTPFNSFAHPTTSPDYPLTVDFGQAVRLHGFSLHFNRQEEIQVSVDLEPLQPLTDMQPVLYLLDATGQPVGATTDLQPTLVWYPPEQWPVGQTVQVRFNTLPWYARQTETYGLALGVVSGDDVWMVERRHRPVIDQTTAFAIRLPANGTLVELAHIEQIWGIPSGGPRFRQFNTSTPPHPIEANFNDQLKLLGYTTPQLSSLQHPTSTSQSLTLSLYWQAITTPPNLVRFAQLIGSDGKVYSQNDSVPDGGHYPTYLWQPGEVVLETVTLPLLADRPAGDYTLYVGLYDLDTGQRLPLTTNDDHVELTGPFFNVK